MLSTGILLSIKQQQAMSLLQIENTINGKASNNRSGTSVALNASGNRVLIGSPGWAYISDTTDTSGGFARVYELNGTSWIQLGDDLTGAANTDRFGSTTAINAAGNRIAVGAPNNDTANTDTGHVRMYEYNGTAWTQLGGAIIGNSAQVNEYLSAVVMNDTGNIVAVSSDRYIENAGTGSFYRAGRLRVFRYEGSAWQQIGQFKGTSTENYLGENMAMNGDGTIIAIGNLYNSFVEVYEYNGSTWTILGSRISGTSLARFGTGLSINAAGNRIAISERNSFTFNGRVFVYEYDGTQWVIMNGGTIERSADSYKIRLLGKKILLNSEGDTLFMHSGSLSINGVTDPAGAPLLVYKYENGSWTEAGTVFTKYENDLSINDAGDVIAIGTNSTSITNVNSFEGDTKIYSVIY